MLSSFLRKFAFALILAVPVLANAADEYPVKLQGLEDSPDYPLVVAGLERGDVILYEADFKNFSVAYNDRTAGKEIIMTFYSYQKADIPLKDHMQAVNSEVITYTPGAKHLTSDVIKVKFRGKEIDALHSTFKLKRMFLGKEQELFSEAILFEENGRSYKVRMTTPIDNADKASRKTLEILSQISNGKLEK